MLAVRPASCITGSSRRTGESPSAKAGRSHLPLLISTQARRKITTDKRPLLGAAAVRILPSTEVRKGGCSMSYRFAARCVNCSKGFGILWVMDPVRVGPGSVARITCPHCGKRFYQDAKDLLPIGTQIQDLVVARPVRSVEVSFDCPYCRRPGILVSLLHTDLSWDDLSKEHVQACICENGLCPERGLVQRLKPTRVILGALNPA